MFIFILLVVRRLQQQCEPVSAQTAQTTHLTQHTKPRLYFFKCMKKKRSLFHISKKSGLFFIVEWKYGADLTVRHLHPHAPTQRTAFYEISVRIGTNVGVAEYTNIWMSTEKNFVGIGRHTNQREGEKIQTEFSTALVTHLFTVSFTYAITFDTTACPKLCHCVAACLLWWIISCSPLTKETLSSRIFSLRGRIFYTRRQFMFDILFLFE